MPNAISKAKLAKAINIKQNKITTFFSNGGVVYYCINNATKFQKIALDEIEIGKHNG